MSSTKPPLFYRFFLGILKFRYFKKYPIYQSLVEKLELPQYRLPQYNLKYPKDTNPQLTFLKNVRFKNISTALIHSPSSTIALFISIISFPLSAILTVESFTFEELWKFLISPSFIFSIFFIIITIYLLPIYLYYYVTRLPLEDYAAFIKNQYNESEMLTFISYKIWEVCHTFDSKIEWMNAKEDFATVNPVFKDKVKKYLIEYSELSYFPHLREENNNYKIISSYGVERINKIKLNYFTPGNKLLPGVEAKINELETCINNLELEIQRIRILIKQCSDRLRISEVELCEHFFQFSPSLYWVYLKKILDSIETVKRLLENIPSHDVNNPTPPDPSSDLIYDLIRAQLYQIDRFILRNRDELMNYQVQNIAFHKHHNDIIDISSSLSSSEPLKIYLKLLSKIAHKALIQFENDKSKYSKDLTIFKKENPEIYEQFQFIFHKRKTHIGLDIHESANEILNSLNQFRKNNKNNLEKLNSNEIKVFPTSSSNLEALASSFNPKNFADILKGNGLSFEILTGLKEFAIASIAYMDFLMLKLEIEFEKLLINLLPKNNHADFLNTDNSSKSDPLQFYVITFGFSKVVRQIAKNIIRKYQSGRNIKIVIWSSEDESNIHSRQIKYQLTEQKNKKLDNVLVSYPEFIAPLISPNTHFIILMGAEAYDDSFKIVRTNTYKQVLIDFLSKNKFQMEKYKIIVCAESYKRHKSLSDIPELFDDQYEKIEIYEPELIDYIVSDDRIYKNK